MKEASTYDDLIYKSVLLDSDKDKEKVYRLINHVIRETWNEALDKAAENVRMTGIVYGDDTCISDYEVDLNSILKLKL